MTMTDVAHEAGVSQATVSRVVNDDPYVSEDVIRRVKGAMERVGYTPNPRRNGPRARRRLQRGPGLVALLYFRDRHEGRGDVLAGQLRGITEALNEHGLGLALADVSDVSHVPPCVMRGEVAGALLAGREAPEGVMPVLRALPRVWLTSYHDGSGDHALAGNEAVGRLAARYLLEQGHKRLAFVNAAPDHPALRVRGEAFHFEAFRQGIDVDTFIASGAEAASGAGMSIETIESLLTPIAEDISRRKSRPAGAFAPTDLMAAVLQRLLGRRGLRVGRDIEIIGCNNQESCLAGLDPRPATIDLGLETMGRHAVEQLLWRIHHPNEDPRIQIVVEPKLIPGETLRTSRSAS
jgi:LacI family transcriptional regulator